MQRQITLRIVGYHFSSRLTAALNLCLIYFKITWALAILLEHMRKKFEINRTKIKGGCQSRRKLVTHNSKSDLPLGFCPFVQFAWPWLPYVSPHFTFLRRPNIEDVHKLRLKQMERMELVNVCTRELKYTQKKNLCRQWRKINGH